MTYELIVESVRIDSEETSTTQVFNNITKAGATTYAFDQMHEEHAHAHGPYCRNDADGIQRTGL